MLTTISLCSHLPLPSNNVCLTSGLQSCDHCLFFYFCAAESKTFSVLFQNSSTVSRYYLKQLVCAAWQMLAYSAASQLLSQKAPFCVSVLLVSCAVQHLLSADCIPLTDGCCLNFPLELNADTWIRQVEWLALGRAHCCRFVLSVHTSVESRHFTPNYISMCIHMCVWYLSATVCKDWRGAISA